MAQHGQAAFLEEDQSGVMLQRPTERVCVEASQGDGWGGSAGLGKAGP